MTTNCKSGRRRTSLLLATLLSASVGAAQQKPLSPETDRLIQTAKVWVAVKYFHPALLHGDIDWDKALLDALPKIRSAQTKDDFSAALQRMLDPVKGTMSPDGAFAGCGSGNARAWVHYGFPPESATNGFPPESATKRFPPESGTNQGLFYAALVMPGTVPQPTVIPLADGLRAQVNLFDCQSVAGPINLTDKYSQDAYPSTEYRILAAFKTWGVIHHFFAYRDLMDEDWDDIFGGHLARFIAAKNAREYNLAVAEMLTHTLDSNVTASSDELNEYFGTASVGLRLRVIEKKPVVIEIMDPKAAQAGVHIGDVIAKVDDEPIEKRFNRIQDYIAGGTPQRRGYDSLQRVLSGADGSTAKLVVGLNGGSAHEIQLTRTVDFAKSASLERPGEPIRMLSENIGYADLTRLSDDRLPAIFEKLQNAKSIVFDVRGPVSPAAKSVAEHLTSANDVAGAIITGPVTLSPDVPTTQLLTSTASYFYVEKVPSTAVPKYTGKTVMLIDERTIGAAEHLGLWLEAANNTIFIGTPSAGAEGETSNFVLPGGIVVTFSGQDVRHGNTGKLQRLGLQPAVAVSPTINGLRKGRDEVLEKAISYLSGPDGPTTRASDVAAVAGR